MQGCVVKRGVRYLLGDDTSREGDAEEADREGGVQEQSPGGVTSQGAGAGGVAVERQVHGSKCIARIW